MTMRYLAAALLTATLALNAVADDKYKEKTKTEGIDPETGHKVKAKSKVESGDDGSYTEKNKVSGKHIKGKQKIEQDSNGNYKEKTRMKTSDGEYKSDTTSKDK